MTAKANIITDHPFEATEPFSNCKHCPHARAIHRDRPDAFDEAETFAPRPGPGEVKTQLFTVNRLHVLVPLEICGEDFENSMEGAQLVALYPGFDVSVDDVKDAADEEAQEGGHHDIATFLTHILAIGEQQDVHEYFFYRERPPIKPTQLTIQPTN